MAEKKIKMLVFDDAEEYVYRIKKFVESKFPSIEVTTATSLKKTENYLKAKGPFNIFSCDILAAPPGVPHDLVVVRIIDLLKSVEKNYPETYLAVISGIVPANKLKGVEYFFKFGRNYEMPLRGFLNKVVKNPWKKTSEEKIDLNQFRRKMKHIDPITGETRWIQLMSGLSEKNKELFMKMGWMGWKPPGKEQAIRNLEISLAHSGTHGRERKLLGNALEILKRPRIMK